MKNINNKITIIEGPTPTFEIVHRGSEASGGPGWLASVVEGPVLYDIAFTTLRAFNSEKLLQRCDRVWRNNLPMFLEYNDEIGLPCQSQIIAARSLHTDEGDMLHVWVRTKTEEDDGENRGYEDWDSPSSPDDPDDDQIDFF